MSTLLVLTIALTIWYLLDCAYDPWRDCSHCHGSPKNRRGTKYHYCAWPAWLGGCGGSGKRRRWGSRLLRVGLGKLD